MNKGLKRLITVLIVLVIVGAMVFLSVFLLAKQKKIFINKWFVDEKTCVIGADVSSYQAEINMNKLKEQNIEFIYIKATEGSTFQDGRFAENWENAAMAELSSGAYHFFSYDSEGRTQAENFIRTVGTDLKGRLLPAVDVEYYGDKEKNPPEKEDVVRELRIYLEMLEEEYGVKPLIYTRSDIYEKYLKGEFDEYKKWMSSLYTPLSWSYKDDWYIWQYLNRGKLEGYTGGEMSIDLNVLNKEKELDDLIIE
ncbi:MAG: glycoside hydrolase family 25 [Oscillospiraceae bacterium]|nr:glycoside hydrolase family 25 [Oscillospiraceae bacterium]